MKRYLSKMIVIAVAAPVATVALALRNDAYQSPMKPFTAKVTILVTSSSVRQAYAGARERYVAEITEKNGGPRLGLLIDRYPSFGDPIRHSLLAERRIFRMRLVRDESCDMPANYVHTPFDAADVYDDRSQSLTRAHGQQSLPCFLVDHAATKLAK